MTEHRYTNRLIHEKSPYLQQHAHNPVNWYPWGEEAFEAARREDKPIFLSIGYSTCHWCHVMAQESFEKEEVARVLNEYFINVKVDREELPEVDALYIEFAQSMMGGVVGWPLNLVLTPDLKPFFAATYLPPKSIRGMVGIEELIARIRNAWYGKGRDRVIEQASHLVQAVADNVHHTGDELPSKEQVSVGTEILFKMADPIYGGINGIPKFPIGYQANLLLRYSRTRQDSRALFLVERTLEMMYRGGIYDHLGGGFSRYSVDEKWLVPHFEKMLYDNALLAHSYLEAYLATGKSLYKSACEEIIEFLLRDMSHPDGGFFSAIDADTEGKEGFFYTWTVDEIEQILPREDAELFCQFYGVSPIGNFQGRNILNMSHSVENFAAKYHLDVGEVQTRLYDVRYKMWQAREEREQPHKDTKIVSGWNGLAIFALAEAGRAFNEPRYLEAAVQAAHFIKNNMWLSGRLFRRWCDGETRFDGNLEDYAYLIRGLISLFEAGWGTEWLTWALELTEVLRRDFKEDEGSFYQTDARGSDILVRRCHFTDGAEPSGNAVHAENLLRLSELTLEMGFLRQAQDVLKGVKNFLDYYPPGYCYHLLVLERYWDEKKPLIVIALNESEEWRREINDVLGERLIPHHAIVWRYVGDEKARQLLPYLNEQGPIDGKTTLYLCYQGACQQPLNDLGQIQQSLRQL